MATSLTQHPLDAAGLVQHGKALLEKFLMLETANPERAWEAVVEIDAVLDELRRRRPPPAFRK